MYQECNYINLQHSQPHIVVFIIQSSHPLPRSICMLNIIYQKAINNIAYLVYTVLFKTDTDPFIGFE